MTYDSWAYPPFLLMRDAVKGQAELIAVSYADRTDLTYKSDQEMEKAYVQYVSGWMFHSFGLHPTIGRLLTENDDLTPGAHPYAVLSYAYWKRRFNQDPKVVGRTVRIGNTLFVIVGVGPNSFTGTEPGTITDIFLPTMMNPEENRSDVDLDQDAGMVCNPASLLNRCARKWMRSAEHSKPRGRRVSSGCRKATRRVSSTRKC